MVWYSKEDRRNVDTLSVGRIALDPLRIAYCGIQRTTTDNEGRSVYGGSDLICVRGGWEALDTLPMPPEVRAGVAKAKLYDDAMTAYPGFVASRRNYDVGRGIDREGRLRSGVFVSSWRIGGASPAELLALTEFMQTPPRRLSKQPTSPTLENVAKRRPVQWSTSQETTPRPVHYFDTRS